MATNAGCSYQLLVEAESWSPSLLEDKALELLEVANTVLSSSDSTHEMKLDCLRWIGDKLVGYVLTVDLEEFILKPFLPSALDFIEEIISVTLETSQGKMMELTTIMVSLLQQSIKVRLLDFLSITGSSSDIPRWSNTVNSQSQSSARCRACLKLFPKF